MEESEVGKDGYKKISNVSAFFKKENGWKICANKMKLYGSINILY